MPTFGQSSLTRLNTCHPKLVTLFLEVVKGYRCSVQQGARTVAEEQAAIDSGHSKLTNPMDSKHVVDPVKRPLALAVDVAPLTSTLTIDWQYLQPFYHFAGYVKKTAEIQGTVIRWGGDWDDDLDFKDQTFNDLVHFELVGT
jgi:peptidoglycan L-alanyl-D-glutamate endopeptidase CwlK